MLKPDAVPTILPLIHLLSTESYVRPDVLTELLDEKEPDSMEAEFLKPVTTRDIGIQWGKIT